METLDVTSCSHCLVLVPQLPELEELMKREKQTILTPLVSLDTPGKATVHVVILADPVSNSQKHDTCARAFTEMSL